MSKRQEMRSLATRILEANSVSATDCTRLAELVLGEKPKEEPKTIYVRCTVPAYVKVDLEKQEVTRVVVCDEDLSSPIAVEDDAGEQVDAATDAKARKIFHDSDFPTWEFGF